MVLIRKRDGGIEDFNADKIIIAITKAMNEEVKMLNEQHKELIKNIADEIIEIIEYSKEEIFSVEEIQDLVEMKLMEKDLYSIAKKYILYRAKRAEKRQEAWEMTELEEGILKNRYFQNGENFEQWLDRVSAGNRAIKKRIRNKQFLFGGRILANRGMNQTGIKSTLSNCFHPTMKVLTESGYKRIDQIEVGEMVLTNDGNYNRVNALLVSDFKGELVTFDSPSLNSEIKATPNHPFFTNEGWIKAEEIEINNTNKKRKNFKLKGIIKYQEDYDIEINVAEFVSKNNLNLVEEDSFIKTTNPTRFYNGAISPHYGGKMFKKIKLDEDVQYLLGRYLGDGSVTNIKKKENPSVFQIVFNAKNEAAACEKCRKILIDKLGVSPVNNHNVNQSTLVLKVNSEVFSVFIKELVGQKENKRFPFFLKNSFAIARGLMDADGVILTNGAARITLANKSLLEDFTSCLKNNGFNVKSKKINNSGFPAWMASFTVPVGKKLIPSLTKNYSDGRELVPFEESNLYEIPISKIGREAYSGKVYNLSVENNHNYVVEGAIVHNCYVLQPPQDNIEGIYQTAAEMARTYSYGGGVGISLRDLRPRGAEVGNSAKETSGAVSFMELYDLTTKIIGQAGRRGALMISMPVNHPDIEEFIDIKTDVNKITKANISIEITNEFMYAVRNNLMFKTSFKFTSKGKEQEVIKEIDAKKLFMKIAENNWRAAEPGMLFWNKISNYHFMAADPEVEFSGTNPLA